jgi:predicted nucleotidyltransferase
MLDRLRRLWRGKTARADLPQSLETGLASLTARLSERGVDHAIIGGVAVSLHGPPRATQDLDLLVLDSAREAVHVVMTDLGFETLQRGEVFANYLLGSLRVDFLFTQGSYSRQMLRRAQPITLRGSATKLVCPEDLIGLKLQALANRPDRAQDRADIEIMLQRFSATMDMQLVRDYFKIFEKEHELEQFLSNLPRQRR